jgi:hypothetical protein
MLPPQSAEWAQLIYATQGSLTVECPVGQQLWYVPARRALWVPAGEACTLRMRGVVRLRMIYQHESLSKKAQATQAINVSPLLHEAILEAVRRSVLSPAEPLSLLIMELLSEASSVPLVLPMPHDPRALRVAKRLLRLPAKQQTLPGKALHRRDWDGICSVETAPAHVGGYAAANGWSVGRGRSRRNWL